MVLVDAGNLYFRMLHIAVKQSNPSKDENGMFVTSEFERQFFHLATSSLLNTRMLFIQKYGELVLTTEGRDLWRKKFYSDYKAQRKKVRDESEINFPEFFKVVDKLNDFIDKSTPIRLVSEPAAEGDDIIAVLAKEYHLNQPILIDSVDHDFIQLLAYPNVTLRNPMKKTFTPAPPCIETFKLEHIICGDKGDNVPNIFYGTQYTDTFIKHLKSIGITETDPCKLEAIDGDFIQKVYDEYNVYKTNRKGEVLCEKDIYKMVPCGPKKAVGIIKNLNEYMSKHCFAKNFERNSTLVLFDKIPKQVHDDIIESFVNAKDDVRIDEVMAFANKHSLLELVGSSSQLLISPKAELKLDALDSLNEWM